MDSQPTRSQPLIPVICRYLIVKYIRESEDSDTADVIENVFASTTKICEPSFEALSLEALVSDYVEKTSSGCPTVVSSSVRKCPFKDSSPNLAPSVSGAKTSQTFNSLQARASRARRRLEFLSFGSKRSETRRAEVDKSVSENEASKEILSPILESTAKDAEISLVKRRLDIMSINHNSDESYDSPKKVTQKLMKDPSSVTVETRPSHLSPVLMKIDLESNGSEEFNTLTMSQGVATEQLGTTKIPPCCKVRTDFLNGLVVKKTEDKGYGVFTRKQFLFGESVCEYSGELLSAAEAKKRNPNHSEYQLYFRWRGQYMCMDAFENNSRRFGRFINHSRKNKNVKPRLVDADGRPRIIFYAVRGIDIGEEILFDYGDQRRDVIESNPWLKS